MWLIVKGKDFLYRQIAYGPHFRGQNLESPDGVYYQLVESMRIEKLHQAYIKFQKERPMAAALLEHLFGNAAFKVFRDFPREISETRAMEMLQVLTPIIEKPEKGRTMRAITNYIEEEIA